MPGPISKDSIAKCSTGDDLYAMIRNPTAKMAPKPVKQIDTIESAQAKQEKNALERLHSMRLPNEVTVVVARAGKFIFLAVAIPPYLLFFGIPKWVLLEATPFFLNFTFKGFRLANQKIKKLFNADKVAIPFRESFKVLKTKASEYIQWINRTTKALFVHLKHQVVSSIYRFIQPHIPLFFKGFQAAENVTKLLQSKANDQAELANRLVQLMWKTVKTEVANNLKPFIEPFKNRLNKFAQKINTLIETPLRALDRFKNESLKKLKKTEEVFKALGQKIAKPLEVIKPLVDWSIAKLNQAQEELKKIREKLIEPIQENIRPIKEAIQQAFSTTFDAMRYIPQVITASIFKPFDFLNTGSIKQFFSFEKGFRNGYQNLLKNLGEGVKRAGKEAVSFMKDTVSKAKVILANWVSQLLKTLFNFLQTLKQLPRKIAQLLKNFYYICINTLNKIGEFIIWMIVLLRISIRSGVQELNLLIQHLSQTVRLKND
jgi:hypothetical protein